MNKQEIIHQYIVDKCRLQDKLYTLASGIEVADYFDLKNLLLNGETSFLAGELLQELLEREFNESIFYGGVGLGSRLITASIMGPDYIKDNNTKRVPFDISENRAGIMEITNQPPPGSEIVIVDDVTSTGGSFLETMSYLPDCVAVGGLVVLDRSRGRAAEVLGAPVKSIFTIDDFN